jgi:hypothetical protein
MEKIFQLSLQRWKPWLSLILALIIFYLIFSLRDEKIDKLQQPRHIIPKLNHCTRLTPDAGPYKEAVISNSGQYCIEQDIVARHGTVI